MAINKNSKKAQLELSLASSMLYYDLEEYSKFSKLWASIENDSSYEVSGQFNKFVKYINRIFVDDNKDRLSKDFVLSKLRKFNSLDPSKKSSDAFDVWLDDAASDDDPHTFNLGEELFYKYVWETFKESVTKIDALDIPYKEKLLVEPVRVDYTEADKIFTKMTDKREDQKQQDIGIVMGSGPLDKYVFPVLSNFMVIAARPGVGKSTLMLKMALENAKKGVKALFVSLEMSQKQLDKKIFGWYKGRSPETTEEIEAMKEEPEFIAISDNIDFIVNYTNNGEVLFNLFDISIKKNGTQIILLDYLQLVRYPGLDEWGSIRRITNESKGYSNNNNVLMVTCSQLSRKSENYGASLADLYGGSTIEADADIVIGIERNEREMSEKHIKSGSVSVLKNRDGASDVKENVIINYIKQSFEDLESEV